MFFVNIDKVGDLYNRINPIKIRFISAIVSGFSLEKGGYNYICDREFLEYLFIVANLGKPLENIKTYTFILECFPEEIIGNASLTKDMVDIFKAYTNDQKLDKLCKE